MFCRTGREERTTRQGVVIRSGGVGGGGGGGGGGGIGIGGRSGAMSRDAASRYEIPGQLQQLLLDFTVSCLVERPVDLVDFAADYFAQLRQRRQQTTQQQQQQQTGGLVAGSAAHGNGHGPESDDSMLTDESDEPSPGKKTYKLTTLLHLHSLTYF